jgi:zinc protease
VKALIMAGAAALALAAASVPAAADTPIPAAEKPIPDPAVRLGTFPNGLHYAIMPNAIPGDAVSIRLAFDVGSYLEADEELGYAHFIEHMAFRSTRQAPNGVLDNRFGTLGVALGRDQNAETTLKSTVYRVDLPKHDVAAVRTVLDWMRGAADGINFTTAAVEPERGVVLSELRERGSALSDMQKAIARFQLPGTRSSSRDPGGTEASVRAATPERLRAFHDRWYRPENARLVIVGDVEPDALIKAAEDAFGSWKADGRAPARPQPAKPAERGLDAFSVSDPNLPSLLSACRVTRPDPTGYSLELERRSQYSLLWSNIMDARIAQRAEEADAPFVGGGMLVQREIPDAVVSCLLLMPKPGKWKETLAVGEAELRRFAREGPTEEEAAHAVSEFQARLNGASYQSGARQTKGLADAIVKSELAGFELIHPDEAKRLGDVVTAGTKAADLKKAFDADWAGTGPLLAAGAPAPLPREALLAAWRDDEKVAPLAAFEERKAVEWAYWDFGRAGHLKHKQKLPELGATRYTFANGTILTLKPTALEPGGVEVRVRFGNGERGLSEKDRVAAEFAAGLLPAGGLGKMEYRDVEAALSDYTWRFTLSVGTNAYTLSSSTLSDQVYQQLMVMAAYMTDPGFRPALDAKLPAVLDLVYRTAGADPSTMASDALEAALFPAQRSLPPRERMEALNSVEFDRLLRPALTGMPAEVTIVGDFDEKYVRKAFAATFGALPPRPPRGEPVGPGPFRRFPDTLPVSAVGYHNGAPGKAAALLLWPLYVATPERRHEELALNILGTIFQTRLMQEIRGAMGKVYSPSVTTAMPDFADQGYLAARFETTSADLEAVVAATQRIAGELAQGNISADELERARGPMVAARQQILKRNAPWAATLAASTRDPQAVSELTGLPAALSAVTLDEVKAAAATWLVRDPMIARALPRPAAASTAASGGATSPAQPPAPSITSRR